MQVRRTFIFLIRCEEREEDAHQRRVADLNRPAKSTLDRSQVFPKVRRQTKTHQDG